MREKIYQTVHIYEGSVKSTVYRWVMIFFIAVSIIPLTVKEDIPAFIYTDTVCLAVFVTDYILRLITADYKFGRRGLGAFARYPLRLISIIDLMSILALVISVTGSSELGIAQAMSVFRIVRILRYSKSVQTIFDILKKSKKPLIAVGSLALGYIVISAIVIFNVEPDSFATFFDAIYWATVSLTTVGYGDIYPVTVLGRVVAMLSSFFGIAIVALPAGIVTAEYLNTLKGCSDSDKK